MRRHHQRCVCYSYAAETRAIIPIITLLCCPPNNAQLFQYYVMRECSFLSRGLPLLAILSPATTVRRACNYCWNIKNYNFHITILTGIPFLQTQWNFRVTSPRPRRDDRKFMPPAPLIAAPDLRPFTVALMAQCVCEKNSACFGLPLWRVHVCEPILSAPFLFMDISKSYLFTFIFVKNTVCFQKNYCELCRFLFKRLIFAHARLPTQFILFRRCQENKNVL